MINDFLKAITRLIKKPLLQVSLVFLAFFTAGLLTLNSYGASWDEPIHFLRGTSYIYYFLTGETTYEKLPDYDQTKTWNDPSYHARSFYQLDALNMDVWLEFDDGHPPLNDILAALSNYVFYQKLGWVGDVESFHLFNIFISSILVAVVFLFALETFGIWAAVFSALFLATYPLFWAESHFNIKDPAESALIVLTVYFFWKAFHQRKLKFLFFSSLAAGAGLATKFNILFLSFTLIPWLVLALSKREILKFSLQKKTIALLLAFPLIMFAILIAIWPYLWFDTINHLGLVFKWYRNFGIQGQLDVAAIESWKVYALQWVAYITQPIMLIFSLIGLGSLPFIWRQKSFAPVLIFLTFFVPVLRVSLPGTNIYGGIRQIMEYIPALSLLAGIGASRLFDLYLNRFKIVKVLVASVVTIILLLPLIRLHPHENVYFNSLIGGLKGATEAKLPAAGNSLGNAYKQGVEWINLNLESKANLALIQNTILNVPAFKIRPDINYNNSYWSGIKRKGEYLMELTYNYENRVYFYAWEYAEKMLKPIYQVKVEGVPLLTIWKNDLEHTYPQYQKTEKEYLGTKEITINKDSLLLKFPKEVLLSKILIYYPSSSCTPFKTGYVETSLDGINFTREKDLPSLDQLDTNEEPSKDSFFKFMFAARLAKFVRLYYDDDSSCLIKSLKQRVFTLE